MTSFILILKRVLGVILIVIGLAALFTPLTPGSWLALIGLELLGIGFLIPKVVREKMRILIHRIQRKIGF